MANYNNTIEKVRDYFLAKEIHTQEEENLLKMINEELEHFPVVRLHRDSIEQVGYINKDITDDMMNAVADKLEEALYDTGFWDSLKIILDDNEDFCHQDAVFCPNCGSGKTFFHDHNMTFMCDKCDHEWKQLIGISFMNTLTEKVLVEKFVPLFKELIPDYSHYELNTSVDYTSYYIYQKGVSTYCATVYQENLWTTSVLTSLSNSKTVEE